MKTLAPVEFIWVYRGPTPPGCLQRGLSISIIYRHTSIYVFFCDINWFFGFHANGRNSRTLRSWEPWWIYVILLFWGHEIATPTRWGIAMITTSTDLPIYTSNLFKGTQAFNCSPCLGSPRFSCLGKGVYFQEWLNRKDWAKFGYRREK